MQKLKFENRKMIKEKYKYFKDDLNKTKKLEGKLLESLKNNLDFSMKKDETEYEEPVVQNTMENENEEKKLR